MRSSFFFRITRPPRPTLFPYTTLFRSCCARRPTDSSPAAGWSSCVRRRGARSPTWRAPCEDRSEEHTSELQSRRDVVCRLLLEKKKKNGREDRAVHAAVDWLQTLRAIA